MDLREDLEWAEHGVLEALRAPLCDTWHRTLDAKRRAAKAGVSAWEEAKRAKTEPLAAALDAASAAMAALEADPRAYLPWSSVHGASVRYEQSCATLKSTEANEALRRMLDAWLFPWAESPLKQIKMQQSEQSFSSMSKNMDAEFARVHAWFASMDASHRKSCGCVCEAHCCYDVADCRKCLVGRTRSRMDGYSSA